MENLKNQKNFLWIFESSGNDKFVFQKKKKKKPPY